MATEIFLVLIPDNESAKATFALEQNHKHLVNYHNKDGFGIGFHHSNSTQMAVIGRNDTCNIIIKDDYVSREHAAFVFDPAAHLISLVTKRDSSHDPELLIRPLTAPGRNLYSGQCVLEYGESYEVTIAEQMFRLVWYTKDIGTRRVAKILKERVLNVYLAIGPAPQELTKHDKNKLENHRLTRIRASHLSVGHYQPPQDTKENVMGEGSFGKVFRTIDLKYGHEVAVKVIKPTGEQHNVEINREVDILKSISHSNIIDFLGAYRVGPAVHIYMGLCQASLNGARLNIVNGQQVLRSVLNALVYIHGKGIVHCDIKPDNIIGYNDEKGNTVIKLSDFGLAQYYSSSVSPHGTPLYQAPECFLDNLSLGPALDIYSLCVTMLKLTEDLALKHDSYAMLMLDVGMRAGKAIVGPIAPMARLDPKERPTAKECLKSLFQDPPLAPGRAMTTLPTLFSIPLQLFTLFQSNTNGISYLKANATKAKHVAGLYQGRVLPISSEEYQHALSLQVRPARLLRSRASKPKVAERVLPPKQKSTRVPQRKVLGGWTNNAPARLVSKSKSGVKLVTNIPDLRASKTKSFCHDVIGESEFCYNIPGSFPL